MGLAKSEALGMTSCAMMATKWSDAQQTLMAFLHAEKVTCNDAIKKKRIHDAQVLVIHYFSLLHAVCLTSLSNTPKKAPTLS